MTGPYVEPGPAAPESGGRPDHPWAGDEDGHNCADCRDGSPWRCDRLAHIRRPEDFFTEEQLQQQRGALAAMAKARRMALPGDQLP